MAALPFSHGHESWPGNPVRLLWKPGYPAPLSSYPPWNTPKRGRNRQKAPGIGNFLLGIAATLQGRGEKIAGIGNTSEDLGNSLEGIAEKI
jgi:hypothetical protein